MVELDSHTLFEGSTVTGKYYIIALDVDRWVKFLSDIEEVTGGDVVFMWGSTWEEDSNTVLEVLGVEKRWSYIPISREDVGLVTWKMRSVRPVVESLNASKVVWVEDDLEGDAFEWANERGSMLAVAPDRESGLSDSEMRKVLSFLKGS